MDFTESFDQFSSKLSTMDLALYAGVGLVLWVLFKDRLSPVQKVLLDLFNKTKQSVGELATSATTKPDVVVVTPTVNQDDVFFKLVMSWKQTRDLAVKNGCEEAVKVADEMFPYLNHPETKDTK